MSYTVLWTKSAEDRLMELWLNAVDPGLIQLRCDKLDAELKQHPYTIGESRSENLRIAFETPLAIAYRVDDQHRVVAVVGVWEYGRA